MIFRLIYENYNSMFTIFYSFFLRCIFHCTMIYGFFSVSASFRRRSLAWYRCAPNASVSNRYRCIAVCHHNFPLFSVCIKVVTVIECSALHANICIPHHKLNFIPRHDTSSNKLCWSNQFIGFLVTPINENAIQFLATSGAISWCNVPLLPNLLRICVEKQTFIVKH